MAKLRMYQVDAFTERVFGGNPAAVVPLESWLDESQMKSIAAENNLSETAFFVPVDAGAGKYHIRWFTPEVEVDLCGHATLASAWVLWNKLGVGAPKIGFDSRSGPLGVERDGDLGVLDFPASRPEPAPVSEALVTALGRRPAEVYRANKLMAVFENKRDVHEMTPDFPAMARLEGVAGVIVTAPGARHDFVSRFFAPRYGIEEDPATGSAHCMLTPYWAKRLGRTKLTGHQVSRRGGELMCEDRGDRVRIGGKCAFYMSGEIEV